MARTKDPNRNFNYEVEIPGFSRFGFSSIDGLNAEHEVIEYREGNNPSTNQKLPGKTIYTDLTLERGKTDSVDFVNWFEEIFDANEGKGLGFSAQGDTFRRTITIRLLDQSRNAVRQWRVFNAWPSKNEHEALDAREGNDVLIERLVICHEGCKEIPL